MPHLTLTAAMGDMLPHSAMGRQVTTTEFLARHPVFSLAEAERELAPAGGRSATVERLKHHLGTGRLKLVARELYAVVPPGTAPQDLQVDPFLCAAAARAGAVFSHHAALELLGAAHSVWSECTVYSARARRPLELNGATVRFLQPPAAMRGHRGGRSFATRRVERMGRLLEVTSPERTLVEGFQRPKLAGGLEELVASAVGFASLDLALLQAILERHAVAQLWAATGWFLERTRASFHAPDRLLERWAEKRPASPQYLERGRRGGRLARRWNLIVPAEIERLGERDER